MTQAEALAILKTGRNVFLTGAAGAGKTYVLNAYIRYLKARGVAVSVTASTGIAATHLGGTTIHSWCGMGIKNSLSQQQLSALGRNRKLVHRVANAAVLVIDEISMLDSQRLGLIQQVIRYVRGGFTGADLQIVVCGDFFQLPPVATENDPPAQFAFKGTGWEALDPVVCYLEEQHRQQDGEYLAILQTIRAGAVAPPILARLKSRLYAAIAYATPARLFSHNVDVDAWNARELARVAGKPREFIMESRGNVTLLSALQKSCLAPQRLELKKGAAVMFVKNDFERGIVNGTLGAVTDFDSETGYPMVQTMRGEKLIATPDSWSIDDDAGKVLAKITQVPLRLAWAMTVHKSQGMSMDAAEIDLSDAFTPGMGYVALSRVRTLSGLRLLGLNQTALAVDERVSVFDEELQRLSARERATLAQTPPAETARQHAEFLRRAGGKRTLPDTIPSGEKQKAYSGERVRKTHANVYAPWSDADNARLRTLYDSIQSVQELAGIFGRTTGAISSRLKKLGLIR